MNFRVGLNTKSFVSDASWWRYGVTENRERASFLKLGSCEYGNSIQSLWKMTPNKMSNYTQEINLKSPENLSRVERDNFVSVVFYCCSSQPSKRRIWPRRKSGRDAKRGFLFTSNLRNKVSIIDTHLQKKFDDNPPRNL